jgi:DNA topoisomerase-3
MSQEGRVYLYQCSFAEKDAAKRAGARWDSEEKKWYVPEDRFVLMEMFNPWRPKGRMYLNCPFSDKEKVKKLGAKWDMQVKKWYIFPSTSISEKDFAEWLPPFHHTNIGREELNTIEEPEKMEDETTRDGVEEMKQYDESVS